MTYHVHPSDPYWDDIDETALLLNQSKIGMKHIIALEGEYFSDEIAVEIFETHGFTWEAIEGLYQNPELLQRLPERDPDAIYIRTTGMNIGGRKEYRKQLKEEFLELNWIPDNVIFFNDDSVFAYQDIAKKLKKYGTNFWMLGYARSDNAFTPINWI